MPVAGDGTGAPGDTDPATDEDDQDPEDVIVEVFDLALTKVVSAPAAGTPVVPGDDVTFTVTVFNQGTIDAYNVDVIDYIPAGFTLSPNDANGWAAAGANATNTLTGPIPSGGSTTIDIVLQVDPTLTTAQDLVNVAEITEGEDVNGTVLPDADSTPDSTLGNDAGGAEETPSDNATGGDGSGAPGDVDPATDEDDADPALVPIDIFDLALNKVVAASQTTPIYPGDDVTFTITVENQGTLDATDIDLIDYIPAGFTLVDPNWANAAGGTAEYTLAGPLAAGSSIQIPLALEVNLTATAGATQNIAEIQSAEDPNGDNPADNDSTPDNDPTNDPTVDDEINNGGGDEDDSDPR